MVAKFGEATEAGLREPVAWAMVNKGVWLGRLDKPLEAIAVCDAVVASRVEGRANTTTARPCHRFSGGLAG